MASNRLIALHCQIFSGGFSGERIVSISLADGTEYKGLAPREYCWDMDNKTIGLEAPPSGDSINGKVAGQLLKVTENDTAVVTIPDGEIIEVSKDSISKRPGITSNVFV
jgi:hypothetical protein